MNCNNHNHNIMNQRNPLGNNPVGNNPLGNNNPVGNNSLGNMNNVLGNLLMGLTKNPQALMGFLNILTQVMNTLQSQAIAPNGGQPSQAGTPGQGGAPLFGNPDQAGPQGGAAGQGGAPLFGNPGQAGPQGGAPGQGGAPLFGNPGQAGPQGGAPGQGGAPLFGNPGQAGPQGGAPGQGGAPLFGNPGQAGPQGGAPGQGGAPLFGNPGQVGPQGGNMFNVPVPNLGGNVKPLAPNPFGPNQGMQPAGPNQGMQPAGPNQNGFMTPTQNLQELAEVDPFAPAGKPEKIGNKGNGTAQSMQVRDNNGVVNQIIIHNHYYMGADGKGQPIPFTPMQEMNNPLRPIPKNPDPFQFVPQQGGANQKPVDVNKGAKAWGDPHFVGAEGGRYDIKGDDNAVYNLLSDRGIQVNSTFKGNLMQDYGVTLGEHKLSFDKAGKLTIDGEELKDGEYLNGAVTKKGKTVSIKTAEYAIDLITRGNYMDIEFGSENVAADGVMPHGLWGQSADGDGKARKGSDFDGTGAIEKLDGTMAEKGDKTYKDYEVDNLFDISFENHNKFWGETKPQAIPQGPVAAQGNAE